MNLLDLPVHMRSRHWIEWEIKHESHKGVHTYHPCACGRGVCRTTACAKCWQEMLDKKLAEEKKESRR